MDGDNATNGKGCNMTASFNGFEIVMTREAAEQLTPRGQDAGPAIRQALKGTKYRRQFDKLNPETIRRELYEYGAWDDSELADDAENRERILWIAACDIKEGKV